MDDNKFSGLYAANKRYVYHVIGRYISHACTIEDLTQHTFMKAWLFRHTFRGESSYRTWLTRIAINTALNFLTQQKLQPLDFGTTWVENMPSKPSESVLAGIITTEEHQALIKAIFALPEALRDVVVYAVVYQQSYEATAEVLGIPIGTVRSRLARARYLLKDSLR